ncbi:4905_t:CDS:2, partial [Racocetra persica]
SKLKIEIDTFDASSRNNDISNRPEVIVLSDTDDEPVLESASSSFIRNYEDLQISSSSESEYNSDNNLNDYVSTDNLKDNDIFENDLKNDNNYEHQPIFAQFGHNLTVDQVEYYLEFQEYPKTSETGVASVPVKKIYCSCLGVKVCEFGSATLDIEHTSVNFEDQLYKNIFDANEFSVDTFTFNTYGQAYNTPCSYIDPITNIRCNGVSILKKYKQFIGCQKYQFGQKRHCYISISQRANMEYLEQLFQNYTYYSNEINRKNYTNKSVNECFTVFPNSSTMSHCHEYNYFKL